MKKISFLAAFITVCGLSVLIGCNADERADTANFTSSTPCSAPILTFASLDEIQAVHNSLYQAFNASQQDEVTLENWEVANNNFYSLRKKDFEMTEGIIPDDPQFDPFNYTSDEILETMLNRDGMVVIDNYLYLWSDGSVIHRVQNNCANYTALLNYGQLIRYAPDQELAIQELKVDYGIEDLVIGMDPRYDFATLSESGTRINNKLEYPVEQQKNDCGLEVLLKHEILNYDAVAKTMKIKLTASTAATIGTTPVNIITIKNASDYNSVTVTSSSNSYSGNWVGFYVGKWVVVEINFSNMGSNAMLEARVTSFINGLSANSCVDADKLELSLNCPLSLSKSYVSYAQGHVSFKVEGLAYMNPGNYTITWSFGDGITATTTNIDVIDHIYAIPCYKKYFNAIASVTATNPLCATKTTLGTPVPIGDPCRIATISNIEHDNIDGKRARFVQKFKKIAADKTKFVLKFRWRKPGTKYALSYGIVKKISGDNCTTTNVTDYLGTSPFSHSGKGRLKQKVVTGNLCLVDLSNPYSVKFSHSDGFTKILTFSKPCME